MMAAETGLGRRDRSFWIALNRAESLSRDAACRLAGRALPGGDEAPLAPAERRLVARIERSAGRSAGRELERARELRTDLVAVGETLFPQAFSILDRPPPAIYVQGSLPDGVAVAVVGARRASRYGLEVADWFARELAAAGVTVVSGFARGVDAAAHRGALETAAGRTVAVLGCGIDVDYPSGQRELARRIAERGARLTEFPFGRRPSPWQFPVRNRLIAALADACVVVEAAPRSGSLVTARLALELGREVLAVPGRVTDESALGGNALIADGARPALDPRDVLEALGLAGTARPPGCDPVPTGVDGEALSLWRAARDQPATCGQLAARTGLAVERTLALLLELEILGHLERAPDGRYGPAR